MVPSSTPPILKAAHWLHIRAVSERSGIGGDVRVVTTDADGLDRVLEVNKKEEVEFPEGFQVRYCRRGNDIQFHQP